MQVHHHQATTENTKNNELTVLQKHDPLASRGISNNRNEFWQRRFGVKLERKRVRRTARMILDKLALKGHVWHLKD